MTISERLKTRSKTDWVQVRVDSALKNRVKKRLDKRKINWVQFVTAAMKEFLNET